MTPRNETLAFKIWAYATPREWDCTVREIAEALEESPTRVGSIVTNKRWGGRLRKTPHWRRDPLGALYGVGMCGLEMLDDAVAW